MSSRRHAALATGLLVAAATGCELPWEDKDEGATAAPEVAALPDAAPDDLKDTGLYTDIANKTLSPRARAFTPAAPLWSDGAEKSRWIDLPDGQTIDATAVDEWRFPVGTKAWKEFRVAGKRVETRFFWKVRADRWLSASYVWSADEASAVRGEGRSLDAGGRTYRVPTSAECNDCHRGRKDRLLGFEAVNLGLDGAQGMTLAALVAEGRVAPAPKTTRVAIADDGTTKAAQALAWLHVNCGAGCHNDDPNATGYPIGLRMKLGFDELADGKVPSALRSSVGVAARNPDEAGQLRVAPGDPEHSLVLQRMAAEGKLRMPPVGSEIADTTGVASVRDWIAALPSPPVETPQPDADAGTD